MVCRVVLVAATTSMLERRLPGFPTQQSINGKSPFCGKETHQKTDQADQIEVIQITCLVQQKKVCESKKQDRRGNAVKEPQHHTSGCQTEHKKVNVHPVPRPGLHPTEPVVSKSDSRFNVVTRDPAVSEVAIDFP